MLAPGELTSLGLALAFVPGTIAATAGVARQEAGLASGILNTSRLFGGALGLAVLATLATSRSTSDLSHPTLAVHTVGQALVNGFQFAFVIAAGVAAVGAVAAVFGMPSLRPRAAATPVAEPRAAVEV
jgi:hypothetical protein